jgi:hypothetical protein
MISFEILPTVTFGREEDNAAKKIVDIMEKIDAKPYELKIISWINLNKSNISRKTMEKYINLALQEFESEIVDESWINEKNIESLQKTAEIKKQNALIYAAVQRIEENTYIIIKVEGAFDEKCLQWESKLKNYYSFFNLRNEIAVNMIGELPEEKTQKEQKKLIENIFKITGSSIIEGISTENTVSYSGYCPELKKELMVDSRKININAAVHNDEQKNKAYVYIGTPILMCEY